MQAHRSIVSSAVATRGHPTPVSVGRVGTKEDLASVAWELQKALAHNPHQAHHLATAARSAPRTIDPNRVASHARAAITTAKAQIDDVKFKVKVTPEYTETTLRISNGHATAHAHAAANIANQQRTRTGTRARTTDQPHGYATQLQQERAAQHQVRAPAAALNYRSLLSRGHLEEPTDHNIRAWISQSSTSLSSAGGKAKGHESLPATPCASTVKGHSSSDGSKGSRGGGETPRGSASANSKSSSKGSRTSSGSGSKRSSTYISAPGNPERLTLISTSEGRTITLPKVIEVPTHRPVITTQAKSERSVVGSIGVTSSYAASNCTTTTNTVTPARQKATIAVRDTPGSKHTRVSTSARGSGGAREAREDDTEVTVDLMALGEPQIKIWPFDSMEHYQQYMDAHPDAANAHFNVRRVDSVPSLARHESSSIEANLASNGGRDRDQRARCETVHSSSGTTSLASSQILHMPPPPASSPGDKTTEHINHPRLTRAQAPASSKGSSESLDSAAARQRHSTSTTRTSRSSDSVASAHTDQSSIYARSTDSFVQTYSASEIYKIAESFNPNDSGFDRVACEQRLHRALIAEEHAHALAIAAANEAEEEEHRLKTTESDAAIARALHQEEIDQANQSIGAAYHHDVYMAKRYPALYERQEREYERLASTRRNAAMRFDEHHLHSASATATATASPSAASDRTVMPDMTPRPGDFKNRTGTRVHVRAPTPHPRATAAPDLNRPLPDTPATTTNSPIEEAREWSWSDDILEIDEVRRAISVYSDRTWPPKPRKLECEV